jgi:hypothetical protein
VIWVSFSVLTLRLASDILGKSQIPDFVKNIIIFCPAIPLDDSAVVPERWSVGVIENRAPPNASRRW